VLGVKQTDSDEVIKKAYRKLAKKYHPDLNPDDKVAEEKMREITEAYDVIGDEEKRKAYDKKLSGDTQKPFTAGKSTAPSSNRPMTQEDFHRMTQNFRDMFSEEAIKKSTADAKAAKSKPIGDAAFFESVIGFKK